MAIEQTKWKKRTKKGSIKSLSSHQIETRPMNMEKRIP